MALTTTVTDDIDGSPGAKPRTFAVGDTFYEIDLIESNYAEFLLLIEPYRSRARVAIKPHDERAARTRNNYAPLINPEDRKKIRAWAIANGRSIPSRGRFPNDVIRDYYATMEKNPVDLVLA